ncbi:Cullin [Gorgonomyces haynaldii]|nr:Cullin [Gorgonomyces haynaldii]
MSLRPKVVQFEPLFEEFRSELMTLFLVENSASVRGMDLYQLVFDLCNAWPESHAERLLMGLIQFFNECAIIIRSNILQHDDIVSSYAHQWKKYQLATAYTDTVCDALNRHLAKKVNPYKNTSAQRLLKLSVQGHALLIWKQQILLDLKQSHDNMLVKRIIDLITSSRSGEPVMDSSIQVAIQSFVELNQNMDEPLQLYAEEFETPLVESTKQYYCRESVSSLQTYSISEFMHQAKERLEEESRRCQIYCDKSSWQRILKACEENYLLIHKQRLETEFKTMVTEENAEDCQLMYQLLNRLSKGTDGMIQIFERHIADTCKPKLEKPIQEKDVKQIVERLMESHDHFTKFSKTTFEQDPLFDAAIDKAFGYIVNRQHSNLQPAEVFAKYCDQILKKSIKSTTTEKEIEDLCIKTIDLFKFIEDKDIFQKFYSRFLAKRLIHGNSVSNDIELSVITHMKSICGYEYTSKLQRMYTDISLSEELVNQFQNQQFHVHVLTHGSWPLSGNTSEFELPKELEQQILKFTDFYVSRHTGRRLTWYHHLARADVKLRFQQKRYDATLSVHQVLVLFLFNDHASLSINEMLQKCRIPSQELLRIMSQFVDSKILLEQDGNYCVNEGFTSKKTKIKIQIIQSIDKEQEDPVVDDDRKFFLQATIVRIMKARKHLQHLELVQEILSQSKQRFVPTMTMIKKAIEQLIEKQFIARQDRDLYQYLS